MIDMSIRAKSYLVIILMISCFGLLYPRILHPMLLNLLGLGHNEPIQNDFIHPRERHLRNRPEAKTQHPSRGGGEPQSTRGGGGGGVMTIVLPVYAIGIVFYLVYTLAKVFGSDKTKVKKLKRESVLQNYYRDFHFDPDAGDFRLNYGDTNPELIKDVTSKSSYKYRASENIYSSTKTLPRDLEDLLQKVDDKNISEEEMRLLRVRLEETEVQLTRILTAMEQMEPDDQVEHKSEPPMKSTADAESSASVGDSHPETVGLNDDFLDCIEGEGDLAEERCEEEPLEDADHLKQRRVAAKVTGTG